MFLLGQLPRNNELGPLREPELPNMKKDKKKEKLKNPKEDTQPKRIADIKEGTYSDGHPLDDVQYLECKIILKGDRFTSVESFYDFAKIVKRAAENADVDFSTKGFKGLLPQIREVLFVDTEDYKLYNNAFILRRRIPYEHGFLAGDPEIVFKFRHPDMQKTADLDVRPRLISDYRIKFKAEMLPLKEEIGGLRMLYSHNVQFPLSQVHEADRASMATLMRVFPPMQSLADLRGRKGRLCSPHGCRGSAPRHWHVGLWQGSHSQGQCGSVANAR